jgi:hypothetical protein
VSQALLGKAPEASGAGDYALARLRADVEMQLAAFKNAAFAAGYSAGKGAVLASIVGADAAAAAFAR